MVFLLRFLLPLAVSFAEEETENLSAETYLPLREHRTNEYSKYRLGDRYEWTLYGARYDKSNFGHRFEWSFTGLSSMSVCLELDEATNGQKWRELANDAYCPKYESVYRWDILYEGLESRCLKVDALTNGQRFRRIVDDRLCKKPDTVFVWEKKSEGAHPLCFEVDGKTRGEEYRQKSPDYLCAKNLDASVAFGRKQPELPKSEKTGRAPASISDGDRDPRFREDPEDLVEHVNRTGDKIHHR